MKAETWIWCKMKGGHGFELLELAAQSIIVPYVLDSEFLC